MLDETRGDALLVLGKVHELRTAFDHYIVFVQVVSEDRFSAVLSDDYRARLNLLIDYGYE